MPIDMRLGKLRGNTSADARAVGPFRTYSQPVNLRDLEARFETGAEVTPESLKAAGLIASLRKDVKVLGEGGLTKALTVTAHGFSARAREAIEAAGGTVNDLRADTRSSKKKSRSRASSRSEEGRSEE
jgi:large subunit ribosomal protein L15